mmetsp:Transcript_13995/g.41628  ORF Transcript_13995/g.41628 Transcript_13995/m.41628 type:complete len:263 (+) Transcript_13995:99-887(+)
MMAALPRLSPGAAGRALHSPAVGRHMHACKHACVQESTFARRTSTLGGCAFAGGLASAAHGRVRRMATAGENARVRESGMPPVDYWETLVDAEGTLDRLGLAPCKQLKVLEFGCGYGTFSVPVAKRVGELFTFDLDEGMVELTRKRALDEGLGNVRASVRDLVADGYGVEPGSVNAVLLMNILHCQDPVGMLRDAASLLPAGGLVYAYHWRYDEGTPRGPPMAIRPRPEQLEEWALATGLLRTLHGPVDCPPWHYGWVFERS